MHNSSNNRRHSSTESDFLRELTKITEGAGIIFLGTVAGKALIFLYTIFLTRLINADGFGLYTLGVTIILYISSLADLGLGVTSTRYIAIQKSNQDACSIKGTVILSGILTFFTSLVIMIFILCFSHIIAITIFKKPELDDVLAILSISLPFECLMRTFLRATLGLKLVKYTAFTEQFLWIALRFLLSVHPESITS